MVKKGSRPSGLSYNNPNIISKVIEDSQEIEELNSNFQSFQDDYSKLLVKSGKSRVKRAYFITFSDNPSLAYISFSTSKEKAKSEAVLYFRNYLPEFSGNKYWKERYVKARRLRVPQFDKYAVVGKVPIIELLKLGMTFSCAICGKGTFNYKDVQEKRCYVVDDGFEVNPFTKGILACPHCYYKKIK